MKEKTVFVVHGRNKKARDSMFTFLRSLGLQPLEWEQAAELTGQASPSTIDIVRMGIGAAQCVVVLFTGDDEARLRPAYGDEPLAPQPRPNVLFEAGWGMAVAGQEATIIVRMGAARQISDLSGLNEIHLTNLAERRMALRGRLESAGCKLESGGTDFLSPEAGGDFEPEYLDPRVPDPVQSTPKDSTDRGTFTNFVVDSALLYRVKSMDLWRNLAADLSRGSRVDLKYHYIGATCAGYWLALVRHPDYGHDRLRRTVEQLAPVAFQAMKSDCGSESSEIDLVSLGPGDGAIDSQLLYRMAESGISVPYYYCIDLSFELLQHAVGQILDSGFLDIERMRVKAIYGDFSELERLAPIYQWDPTVNLFSLMGNTLGNYNESFLLRGIRAGMNDGDYLLLDAKLRTDTYGGDGDLTEAQRDAILYEYKHQHNNLFAFGPVEVATSATSEDVTFGYEVSRRITDVPGALNVITYCEGLKARLKGQSRKVSRRRLELAATTLYSFDELRGWFGERGFKVIWSDKGVGGENGLFLLKKTDTGVNNGDR